MRLPFLQGLAARLVASHLLVGVISVGLIASIAGHFILDSGRREVENVYDEIAFLISNNLEMPFINLAQGNGLDPAELKSVIEEGLTGRSGVKYTVFLADGTPVVSNETGTDFKHISPEVQAALQQNEGTQIRTNEQGYEAFYVAVPIIHETTIYGVLRLSATFRDNMAPTYRSLYLLGAISILLLLGVAVGSWWFSYTLSQPIKNLTEVAGRYSNGDLSSRAELKGPNELRQFSNTFNQMAVQLQNNMDGMRAFVANASHELRTPMTAIKLHVDALAEGAIAEPEVANHFLSQLQDEIDRMSRTVNDLLDLSRIEANRGMVRMEEVNLAQILLETRDFWRARSVQAEVDLRLSIPSPMTRIVGNEDQLSRVFHNLVDNAIKHTAPGGWVEISLFNLPQRGVVRVEVRDSGIGIPAENLSHIFDRFYRVELPYAKKISGSGLGLAIAKTIVEAHHGKIGVSSIVGVGSTFWVELSGLSPSSLDLKTIPAAINTNHE